MNIVREAAWVTAVAAALGALAAAPAPPADNIFSPNSKQSARDDRAPTAKPPAPAKAADAAPAGAPANGTAEAYIAHGKALLEQRKFGPALEQFNLALQKDRSNADAWHGSALCYQAMNERAVALERFEKAVTLYDPPSRAAVFNCAAANLRDNPMRAARMVKDYLSRDGVPRDEAMHDLMGRALFGVNRQGRQNKLFAEAETFYFEYNKLRETGRADERKRWGSEWVPGREAVEKWQRYRTRLQNVENQRTAVDHATKDKKDAWGKLYDQRTGMKLVGTREQKAARDNYEGAARQEIKAREQLRAAEREFNSTEKPPLPQVFKPVPMDTPAPPPAPAPQPAPR